MGRRKTRTRSGRLRASERRRKLRAAALKPGEVILLDVTRTRSKGVRGSKNSLSAEWVVNTQVAMDFDIRKLLHRIRVALALHFQASLLAGKRSNSGVLPKLREKTLRQDPGRSPDSFAVDSGELAERWELLKIRGGPFNASTKIKPYGGGGRSFAINKWLDRGIDLQSVDGASAGVIEAEIRAWMPLVAPKSGDGVGTPAKARREAGELPRFTKG